MKQVVAATGRGGAARRLGGEWARAKARAGEGDFRWTAAYRGPPLPGSRLGARHPLPASGARVSNSRLRFGSAGGALLGFDRQHAVDHLAGKAEVVCGVAHLFELGALDVLRNLRVGGEEIDQRLAGRRRLSARVVDGIGAALARALR